MVQTVDFRGVPICRVGEWNPLFGDGNITHEELKSIVESSRDPEVDTPRVKIGHVSSLNSTALGDGAPALGWIENLRMDDDDVTLLGDLVDVPKKLGGLIGKAYREVSIEMRRKIRTPSGKKYPAAMRALALLGLSPGAVKGLGSFDNINAIADLYASESEGQGSDDECTESEVSIVQLGDALDPVTHADIPVPSPVACDGVQDSPDRPGREKEGEPSMAFLDQAREKFGLPADASEEQILERITALSEAPAAEGDNTEGAEDDKDADENVAETSTEVKATPETVTVSKAVLDEMNARIAELDAEAKARREAEAVKHREEVIAAALSEGRIAPSEREHWVTALSAAPEANEKLITSLAPRVNVTERGSDVALSAGVTDQAADDLDSFLDSLNLS